MSNILARVSKVKFQELLSALAEVNSSLAINRGSLLPTQQFQVNIKHQGHQKNAPKVIFFNYFSLCPWSA